MSRRASAPRSEPGNPRFRLEAAVGPCSHEFCSDGHARRSGSRHCMKTLAHTLGLLALVATGCAKRAADEGKRPVERAAPGAPLASAAREAPASVPEKTVAKGRDLCRGERLPADQHYVP